MVRASPRVSVSTDDGQRLPARTRLVDIRHRHELGDHGLEPCRRNGNENGRRWGECPHEPLTMAKKLQAPSSNLQRNSKNQTLNRLATTVLRFEVWSFSGAWMLDLPSHARVAHPRTTHRGRATGCRDGRIRKQNVPAPRPPRSAAIGRWGMVWGWRSASDKK
jgi:hypothetical protein